MTPAPVEIARKVLEAGEKATDTPWVAFPSTIRWHGDKSKFDQGIWHILPVSDVERVPIAVTDHGDDHHEPSRIQSEHDAAFIVAACNGAEALARAVIAMRESLQAIKARVGCECMTYPGDIACAHCIALAALSPTEGDGRKENNDAT